MSLKQNYYILIGRRVVPADAMAWCRWMEAGGEHKRCIGNTTIGETWVSTVFLGLDHQYGVGPPLLFETMTFGGPNDQSQARCSTYEEAEAQHRAVCNRVRGYALKPAPDAPPPIKPPAER